MKVKVSDLQGAALDWAVLAALYGKHDAHNPKHVEHFHALRSGHPLHQQAHYSTDWGQGGPIIEREKLKLRAEERIDLTLWVAATAYSQWAAAGPTPLVAAMRCYVASKMGDEIEIPDELH